MDKLSQAAEYADMTLIILLAILIYGSLGAFETGNIELLQMIIQMLLCVAAIVAICTIGLFQRLEYICRKGTKK